MPPIWNPCKQIPGSPPYVYVCVCVCVVSEMQHYFFGCEYDAYSCTAPIGDLRRGVPTSSALGGGNWRRTRLNNGLQKDYARRPRLGCRLGIPTIIVWGNGPLGPASRGHASRVRTSDCRPSRPDDFRSSSVLSTERASIHSCCCHERADGLHTRGSTVPQYGKYRTLVSRGRLGPDR